MSDGTDWCWCYENPKDAASEIDALRQRVAELEKERDDFALSLKNSNEGGKRLYQKLTASQQRIEELESTRPVCSLCAMSIDESAGVDVAALNRRIEELEAQNAMMQASRSQCIEELELKQ